MKGSYRLEKPNDVEFSLTITMSADQWDRLHVQLQNVWPSSRLSVMISNLLRDARRVYSSHTDAVTGARSDPTGTEKQE